MTNTVCYASSMASRVQTIYIIRATPVYRQPLGSTPLSSPHGRGKEGGQGTPGKETQKGKQKGWDTPRERWRRWPQTDNSDVHLAMHMLQASKQAYVNSEVKCSIMKCLLKANLHGKKKPYVK